MPLVIAAEPIPVEIDADGVARVGGTRVTLDTIVAADENFNNDIVRGLLRREPKLDIVRIQDVGLSDERRYN